MDRACLRRDVGQRTEALERLVSISEGITRSFDTMGVKEAKKILDTPS